MPPELLVPEVLLAEPWPEELLPVELRVEVLLDVPLPVDFLAAELVLAALLPALGLGAALPAESLLLLDPLAELLLPLSSLPEPPETRPDPLRAPALELPDSPPNGFLPAPLAAPELPCGKDG
ncbi:MAG: hypothetical protein ACR2G6_17935 [Gemmatimonadaceae bacterium]